MLISEIKRWHYFISWDNPEPADSSTLLEALGKLGKLSELETKTSVVLAPRSSTTWQDVRKAIKNNLNPVKGKAFYVNLRSGQGFEIGKATNFHWRSAN